MRVGKVLHIILWTLLVATVLVVIMAVILTPNTVIKYKPNGRQRIQFHSMDAALELFNTAFEGHPPSDALDGMGAAYCGAMKLCEALMGRDLLGFHSESIFRADGKDAEGRDLYDPCDLSARKGPYLPPESAEAVKLVEVYGKGNAGPFSEAALVLCDEFWRTRDAGRNTGMPILYYRADTSKTGHDVENPDNPENIYNYEDNHALLGLGVPGQAGKKHPLFVDPKILYEMTRDTKVKTKAAPCNADSFILISAGLDGLYGTKDDVVNFDR
jgi:hypothetical protein